MKRILVTLLAVICLQAVVQAKKTNDVPSFKFNGCKYSLLYSTKSPELGSYINEYYKPAETYTSWSELITVHHNPNVIDPIKQAQALKEYLDQKNISNEIEINEDNNSALVSFIMSDTKKIPIVVEFNIFKYQLDEVCGALALQYTKRYIANDNIQAEYIKKDFIKNKNKQLKKFNKLKTPTLVLADIDKGNYVEDKDTPIAKEKENIVIEKTTENDDNNSPKEEETLDE